MAPPIRSADATRIAASATGEGRSIVIVHGAVNAAADWAPVATLLSSQWRCWTYDRRGRGDSGDGTEYSLACEVDDLDAVLAAAAPVAAIIGHSFGGIVALEAATRRRGPPLILYEPPLAAAGDTAVLPQIAAIESLIADGREDEALARFLVEQTRMPVRLLEPSRSSRAWTRMVAATRCLPREMRAVAALPAALDRYAGIATPVHTLVGQLSGPLQARTVALLAATLPQLTSEVLAGQGHAAHRSAPDRLAGAILAALADL